MSSRKSKKRSAAEIEATTCAEDGFLSGVNALILEPKLGKARAEILAKQLARNGGKRHDRLQPDTTHVLVDNDVTYSKATSLIGKPEAEISRDLPIVRADWLSSCLTSGTLTDHRPFEITKSLQNSKCGDSGIRTNYKAEDIPSDLKLSPNTSPLKSQSEASSSSATTTPDKMRERQASEGKYLYGWRHKKESPRKKLMDLLDDDSDYVESGGDDDDELEGSRMESELGVDGFLIGSTGGVTGLPAKRLKGNWACAQSSTVRPENINKHITDKLEILAKMYKNTKDQWRAMMYTKAITALKNHPKEVTSYEEALEIPFVGKRLADKIAEIASSGHLRRLNHLDPDIDALDRFTKVWGVGPTTARQWVDQGLRTLEDLKEKGNVNRQQLVGLKHYDDFIDRIPREEATAIGDEVRQAALSIVDGLDVEVCGSYRRGKETCGDVDVLISHPDGRGHRGVFKPLIQKLTAAGFLTDDLVIQEDGTHQKYLGVCRLAGKAHKYRRLDIIVVPYCEWACSLLYFTGSAYFNRSMRLFAQKKGMQLSQHGLYTGVLRNGKEIIHNGISLPCFSERDVFEHLGLNYLKPHERDQ
ncbi:DNA polymerase lambda-like [Corticium candelabrum]|uniref:DNA polymerase lambda-like n=1 Tax=Corticium candelabrum TaxID=121492 RepID=UPI002E259ADF|nr:DNA polymerase lambda-like [Corticium candelabrum]